MRFNYVMFCCVTASDEKMLFYVLLCAKFFVILHAN